MMGKTGYSHIQLTLVNENNPKIVRHTSLSRRTAIWQENLLAFFTQADIDAWGLETATDDLIALLLWDRRVNATIEIISSHHHQLNGRQWVKKLSKVS